MPTAATPPVQMGRIVGLFGVKGWVRVYSYTEPREALLDYKSWLVKREDAWQPARLAEGQRHGTAVIARLESIEDRDRAAELVGSDIGVNRRDLPEPEAGHYYWADLVGMTVTNRNGADMGHVAYVMATGANDVLVTKGERERMIPFVIDKVVLDVDLAAGRIVVEWDPDWD